jgi:hypothetical protein
MLKFFLSCFARQDSTLDQGGQDAFFCVSVRHIPAAGESIDDSGKFRADRRSRMTDRIYKQYAIVAHRQQVDKA